MRTGIAIAQKNKDFLLESITLFKELGIKCNGPTFHKTKLGEWYTIRIENKEQFCKFSKIIPSCHAGKLQRIKDMVIKIEENRSYKPTIT